VVDAALLRRGARWWEGRVDRLLVEGVGGLLCPLTDTETVADLAVDLGYPLLIVARLGLGTVNHTLLTVEAARSRGLEIAGILLNAHETEASDESSRTNAAEIERRSGVPVLGVVPRGPAVGLRCGGQPFRMDWSTLARN
jgi:dethiobiotin synthetase